MPNNAGEPTTDSYKLHRQDIGRATLLGLEVLVAADIIRTVAVTPTLTTSVAVLAGIVIIRTFLNSSLGAVSLAEPARTRG